MKTHTSKQAFWFRSFILLPLLALLIYSFSEKKVIEKPPVYQIVNGDIKVFITKDKTVTIDNETILFNALSDKLVEMTKNEKNKPLVYIEIEGYIDIKYLEQIKNELEKTNLKISMIRANSMFLDENEYKKSTKDYFKGIPFTGDTLAFKNENNELMFGISSPSKLSAAEIDIIKKSFSEKYNITGKKPHIITGIKEPSNPNPFSLTMTDEDTTSTQDTKSYEDYDIITLKVPRNKNHFMSSSDIKSLQEHAEEIYSIKNKTSRK